MGLNKLMRRRVSGSVATRVTMRATLVQLREDEDETTSVRAITLHCELREEPIGLLYVQARAQGTYCTDGRGRVAGAMRLGHMRIKHGYCLHTAGPLHVPEMSSVRLPACCFAASLLTSVFASDTTAVRLARPVEVMS